MHSLQKPLIKVPGGRVLQNGDKTSLAVSLMLRFDVDKVSRQPTTIICHAISTLIRDPSSYHKLAQ